MSDEDLGEKLGRYGENPHQEAWLKRDPTWDGPTVLNPPLHGKPLGSNNILDADAALGAMLDLRDRPAVVVIKHQNPCGLATGKTLGEAFEHAWLGDEVSAFGSIVGYTQEVILGFVELLSRRFVECVVAPSFSEGSLEWIRGQPSKADLRVIATGSLGGGTPHYIEQRTVRGGVISQTADNRFYLCDSVDSLLENARPLKEPNSELEYRVGTVTDKRFKGDMQGLIQFSIIAGKHIKSNAIAIVYEYKPGQYRLLGMGAGQPNRLDSVQKLAVTKARENLMRQYFREQGLDYAMTMGKMIRDPTYRERLVGQIEVYTQSILGSDRVVLFSDAFFPKRDGLDAAADAGIRYVVTPGGSKSDSEVIAAADQCGVAMIFTGIRHFRH